MYIIIVEVSKDLLRREILEKRMVMSLEERIEKSRKIKDNLFILPEYRNAKTVMFYMAVNNEVETREMILESLRHKRVLLPKIKKDTNGILPVEIKELEDLCLGLFNIPEPKSDEMYDGKIDIVIVPGIVFDLRGYRIGHGKGYYDRFLRDISATKAGLAFDFQVVERIPEDSEDVPVDVIVTESRVIRCRKPLG